MTMISSPVLSDPDPVWTRAEAFRRAGIYKRAGDVFEALWKSHHDPTAGWRWAYCLRGLRLDEEALSVARAVARDFPDNPQVHTEYLWCLYAGSLKLKLENGAPQEILEAATELVEAGAEGVVLKLAAFAAIAAAKQRGQWSRVDGWCDLLPLDELERLPRGRGRVSERERYYYAKLKAQIQLEQWQTALKLSQAACQEYPDNQDFSRWLGLALRGNGELEQAVEVLEALRRKGRVKYYCLADLARCRLELGQTEEAWKDAADACRAPGEDSAKVVLFETMARIGLALDQPALARDHLGLCIRLRNESGWSVGANLLELEDQVSESCGSLWESAEQLPVGEWKRRCRSHWELGPSPPVKATLTGCVTGWEEGRKFAFIQTDEDKEAVFVRLEDLPEPCRQEGARVKFAKVRSYDKKRQREAWQATRVSALE